VIRLTLVGPEGQVVSYSGRAIPGGDALRTFFAHGWHLPPANGHALGGPDAGLLGSTGARRRAADASSGGRRP
jgi:hypothetical protein